MKKKLFAVIKKEGEWFVAECPQIGTVSQGHTKEEALENLKEATSLYLEEDPDSEIASIEQFSLA